MAHLHGLAAEDETLDTRTSAVPVEQYLAHRVNTDLAWPDLVAIAAGWAGRCRGVADRPALRGRELVHLPVRGGRRA